MIISFFSVRLEKNVHTYFKKNTTINVHEANTRYCIRFCIYHLHTWIGSTAHPSTNSFCIFSSFLFIFYRRVFIVFLLRFVVMYAYQYIWKSLCGRSTNKTTTKTTIHTNLSAANDFFIYKYWLNNIQTLIRSLKAKHLLTKRSQIKS